MMPRTPFRRTAAAAFLAALAALAACSGPGAAPTPPSPSGSGGVNRAEHLDAPYVVLVSFDGFRPDYVELAEAGNFRRVAAAGVRADAMIPVYPTKTFPNHYTIATGMYAERHGLVGNSFWDPERGAAYAIGDRAAVEEGSWYGGEPIWVTAERQGMVAASYFFVGSEADVGGVRPTFWHRYDGSVAREERVDAVLAWLALPPARRPHMITLYFSDTDDAGHRYGPGSPEVAAAVADVDRALGRLLDGLEALPDGDDVYVVLVSDHGMIPAPAAQYEVLDLADFPGVRLLETGPYASVVIDEGGPGRHVQLRDSLQARLRDGAVYLREDVPGRFHYRTNPRIGDLVVVMEPEWSVAVPGRVPRRDGFNHGWDNRVEGMGALFLARGPGIAAGQRVPAFESVHVYPFLAHLLGLEPNPAIDGSLEVLAPVLGR